MSMPARLPTGEEIFSGLAKSAREFHAVGEGHYVLAFVEVGIRFDIDRLRRDHHELWGELAVQCDLPGARTVNGNMLSIADLNVSSANARRDRARLLADRASMEVSVWSTMLEELCQRVLSAERQGQPALSLRELPRPAPDDTFHVDGLRLLKRHPAIMFGDGGNGKSYLALYLVAQLARRGIRVGLFDWESVGDEHRDRLERLCGGDMPDVAYARCERPLFYEADRLRRIVHEQALEYAIFDSVAFACDGPPEAAEVAGRYFRAVRQIGIGSLHLAHITKGEHGDQRPFGSTFWHNGARASWFLKRTSPDTETMREMSLGLFPRKANFGPLRGEIGFRLTFSDDSTRVAPVNVADVTDLAAGLTLHQRMAALLRRGSLSVEDLADELGAKPDTVRRTADRYKTKFTRVTGVNGQTWIGLLERRHE